MPFDPQFLNLGLLPGVVFIGWMLATGRLATARELRELRQEIHWLRQRNDELNTQYMAVVQEHAATTIKFLNAFDRATEASK